MKLLASEIAIRRLKVCEIALIEDQCLRLDILDRRARRHGPRQAIRLRRDHLLDASEHTVGRSASGWGIVPAWITSSLWSQRLSDTYRRSGCVKPMVGASRSTRDNRRDRWILLSAVLLGGLASYGVASWASVTYHPSPECVAEAEQRLSPFHADYSARAQRICRVVQSVAFELGISSRDALEAAITALDDIRG